MDINRFANGAVLENRCIRTQIHYYRKLGNQCRVDIMVLKMKYNIGIITLLLCWLNDCGNDLIRISKRFLYHTL